LRVNAPTNVAAKSNVLIIRAQLPGAGIRSSIKEILTLLRELGGTTSGKAAGRHGEQGGLRA